MLLISLTCIACIEKPFLFLQNIREVQFDSAGDLTYTLTLYNCPATEVRDKPLENYKCKEVQSHTFNSAEIHTEQEEEQAVVTAAMDSTAGAGGECAYDVSLLEMFCFLQDFDISPLLKPHDLILI